MVTHALTSLCLGNDDDLEYYVREAGDILGVTGKLEEEQRDGKHILGYIFKQVGRFGRILTSHTMLVLPI